MYFLQKINYLHLRWQEVFPYSSLFFRIKLKCTEHKTATVLSSLAKTPLPQRMRTGFKEINKLQRNQSLGCIINSQAAFSEVTNRKVYVCKIWLSIYERKGKQRKEKEETPVNIYTFHILQEKMWFQYTYSGDKYTLWNLVLIFF